MQNNLFNPETIGGNGGFYWWTGIIVSNESWKENQVAEKWSNVDTLPGWGARYKVRIAGKHTQVKNKLSDDKLELCDVLYPVTAGSGHAASYQTSNLRQGSVVLGFYKDGIDGNEPIILGCIGNNEQTFLNRTQENGFDPLSAFNLDNPPPYFAIPKEANRGQGGQSSTIESNTLSSITNSNIQDEEEVDKSTEPLSSPVTCDKTQLGAIQIKIRNLIQSIERVKKQINNWRQVVTDGIQDVEQFIRNAVNDAAKFIAGGVKWIITEIQKFVTKTVNDAAKNLYYMLFPNERPGLKRTIETANDLIACLFRKIISNLLKMIGDFLLQAVDRFINVPLCAVENMIGGLIGKIVGLINSALQAILAPIQALLGAFDIVGDVIGFLTDLLTFLSCDEKANCPQVKEWNIWDGAGSTGSFSFDVNGLIDNAKSFASNIQDSFDPDNFSFDLDFSDVFDNPCNVNAVLCGPPTVEFFGGGGSGAAGNVIVSAVGEILGVDVTSFGSGYNSAPFVRFIDACGNGTGAVGRAVIGPVDGTTTGTTGGTTGTTGVTTGTTGGTGTTGATGTTGGTTGTTGGTTGTTGGTTGTTGGTTGTTGVTGVIMDDTGTGYLPSPDGSLGGDGRTWADPDQTTVQRNDGTYDTPYNPGDDIELSLGDSVRLPNNTSTELGDEIITGGRYQQVNQFGTITAPTQNVDALVRGDYPALDDGKYPVILYLCGLEVENGGFGYADTDEIIIEPSNGAVAVPKYGAFGALESVKITSGGEGFTQVPRIYIQSETGYNAKLIPRFCIDRISKDEIKEPGVQDKIISVIDCVGKIPDVSFFRVPR